MKIQVVISGRAYHTMQNVPESLDMAEGATLDDALDQIGDLLSDDQRLPTTTMIAVRGKHLGTVARHEPCPLHEGDELVLIVPVAGG